MDSTLEFTKQKVSQTMLTTDPWDYMYVENFLPQEFYDKLNKETLSMIDHNLRKDNPARRRVCLYDSRNHPNEEKSMELNIKKGWIDPKRIPSRTLSKEFCNIFLNKDLQDLLLLKFKNSGRCSERPQPKPENMYATYDIQTPGYKYHIHADSGQKIFSILLYLADEGDDENLGTRLYPSFTKPPHLDFHKDLVKIAPYKPNSLFLFSRINEGWYDDDGVFHRKCSNHAMTNPKTSQVLRRSIQVNLIDPLYKKRADQ